jgi:hypothetical protein
LEMYLTVIISFKKDKEVDSNYYDGLESCYPNFTILEHEI